MEKESATRECAAVARVRSRADELAGSLQRVGVAARAETDVDICLERDPPLVLIDPTGWETYCRVALEAFGTRLTPPPAVLFSSPNSDAIYTAGPAYGALPAHFDTRELAAKVARALHSRERFSPRWPSLFGLTRSHDLRRVERALEAATGLAIRPDRRTAFLSALRTRMVAKLTPTAREYADLMERRSEGAAEVELLAGLLCVGETHFWRYSGQYRALQTILLPALVDGVGSAPGQLRVWSAGCSSGEEAHSLAMACTETLGLRWKLQVVGTDIHRPSLARANDAVYRPRSLRNLPPHLLRRYMEPADGDSRVREAMRHCVRFEVLNLGSPELEEWIGERGPFDVIFCRNTLIYFSRRAADRVLRLMVTALAPGGGLFLGASETIQPPKGELRVVRGPGSYFYIKEGPGALRGDPKGPSRTDSAECRCCASADSLYAKGLSHLDVEDFHAAAAFFHELLAAHPDDARGHTGLALVLANRGSEAEALESEGTAA